MTAWLQEHDGDVLVRIKAVPGASRDAIAGLMGDRLKVRVSAPPEGGKANAAICRVIAEAVGVRANRVLVEAGATSPHKTVRINGLAVSDVQQRLG